MNDAAAIHAAYYARLQLLFAVFADGPDDAAAQRFRAGIAQARAARDRALQLISESKS